MNLLITPKEQILAELQNIDSFLNITMSENAEEAVQRGNDLAVCCSLRQTACRLEILA